MIVVVGGDGIINEVVNGIVFLKCCFKMVIILIGIINDFVCVLKILWGNFIEVIKLIGKN